MGLGRWIGLLLGSFMIRDFLAGTILVGTEPGVPWLGFLLMASNLSVRSISSGICLLILKLLFQIPEGGDATPATSPEMPLGDVWPGVSFMEGVVVGFIPSSLICGIL